MRTAPEPSTKVHERRDGKPRLTKYVPFKVFSIRAFSNTIFVRILSIITFHKIRLVSRALSAMAPVVHRQRTLLDFSRTAQFLAHLSIVAFDAE